METLSLAFLGHLVGDYLLQTDWMAMNKKQQSLPAAIHCLIWSLSVLFFTGWGWQIGLVLFVFHFIQDRTQIINQWMNRFGQKEFANGPFAPWSLVIVDNTFHLLQIWLVWKFMT